MFQASPPHFSIFCTRSEVTQLNRTRTIGFCLFVVLFFKGNLNPFIKTCCLCTLCNATLSPSTWKACQQSCFIFIFVLQGALENSFLPCSCFTTARELACPKQNCLPSYTCPHHLQLYSDNCQQRGPDPSDITGIQNMVKTFIALLAL